MTQNNRVVVVGLIHPAMLLRTVEIQGVAGFDVVVLRLVEPDVELSAEHVHRLLAVVGVRTAAASARSDVEDVDLEHGVRET